VVETGALATRIVLDHGRAVAVEYLKDGESRTAHAEREIILAGGVINSPQLLMLSGIGDPDELRGHGIDAVVPLRGVGRNLQDHISAGIAWKRSAPGPLHGKLRADRIAVELARAYCFGTGVASDLFGGVMAFLKSSPGAALPDIQLLFNAAPMTAGPWLPPFRAPYDDGYACRAVLLRPESRGRLQLASADPLAPVRIRQNFLATDKDRATLRAGLDMVRDIGRQAPLAPFRAAELSPGADGDLDAHVRATAITVHHPLGTCRMGQDDDSVVDPELRVRGVEGLRVVDASVMPDLVGGNINAPVIMIAEKAADLIRGRPPLAPVNV
jgi:choline dehydrogenase/4-pyridoxate dehydrogenase